MMKSDEKALLGCLLLAILVAFLQPNFFQGGALAIAGKYLVTVVALYLIYKFFKWIQNYLTTR